MNKRLIGYDSLCFMNPLPFIFIAVLLLISSPALSQQSSNPDAVTLTDSMQSAAAHFAAHLQRSQTSQELSLTSVINLTSKTEDDLGKQIRETLRKELLSFKVSVNSQEITESDEAAYVLSGAYIKAGSRIMLKLSLSTGKTVNSEFEAEWLVDKTGSQSQLLVMEIEGNALHEDLRKAFSKRYRGRLCQGYHDSESGQGLNIGDCVKQADGSANVKEVVSTSVFKMGKDTYLIFSKVMDNRNSTLLRSKTVEHNGSLDSLGDSLDKLADLMTGNGKVKSREKESLISRSKWHITALSITALSLWVVYDETSKYNDLSEENSQIKSQYLLTPTQPDTTRLKNKYNDNASKMEEHEETITQMYVVAALAIGWEAYLLYKVFQSQAYQDQARAESLLQMNRIHVSPVVDRYSSGLRINLSWRF